MRKLLTVSPPSLPVGPHVHRLTPRGGAPYIGGEERLTPASYRGKDRVVIPSPSGINTHLTCGDQG